MNSIKMKNGIEVISIDVSVRNFKLLAYWASVGRTLDAAIEHLSTLSAQYSNIEDNEPVEYCIQELLSLKPALDEISSTCTETNLKEEIFTKAITGKIVQLQTYTPPAGRVCDPYITELRKKVIEHVQEYLQNNNDHGLTIAAKIVMYECPEAKNMTEAWHETNMRLGFPMGALESLQHMEVNTSATKAIIMFILHHITNSQLVAGEVEKTINTYLECMEQATKINT